MYVTPHRWTQFAAENRSRKIVQLDQSKWDYRHQVFEQKHLRPWQLLLAVKWLELRYHLRPKRLLRILTERHPFQRRQLWWNLLHTSLVWSGEILAFLFATSFAKRPISLARVHGDGSDRSKLPVLPVARSTKSHSILGDQIYRSDEVFGSDRVFLKILPGDRHWRTQERP